MTWTTWIVLWLTQSMKDQSHLELIKAVAKSCTVCNHGSLFPQSMPICIVAVRSERKGDNRTPTSQHHRLANSLIVFWPANRKGGGSSQSCKMHAETEPTCAFMEAKLCTNLLPNLAHIFAKSHFYQSGSNQASCLCVPIVRKKLKTKRGAQHINQTPSCLMAQEAEVLIVGILMNREQRV